jgi:hypothetical protein
LLLQAGDDRLAVDPVLLRLGLVAADDVAGTVHLDLFRKQLGFAPAALDQQRGKGGLVGEHDIADHSRAAFPSPENVFELSLLQGLEGGGGDHAPVGHHADPPDPEPLAQPIHHRQQHGAVGGIAGKHLGADRTPLAIDHDSQNHLLEVRPVILGVAVGTEALTTRPLEREGRGIHEHNREIGKQVAPPFEQLLLDQVLDAAWGQITLGGRLHLLAEPGHGPIEVMQSQIAGAGDGVVGHPLLTRSKSARTSAIPSRSHSRPKRSGPPMRVQAIRPASISVRIMARSECRASEAINRSSSPLASNASLRPRARMVRWRTRPPSRTLSTR